MITNKLRFVLLVTSFLTTQFVFGQVPVIIKGKFQPEIVSTQLSVYKPYTGYFNVFYPDAQSETIIKDSEFKLQLSLDKPGFVRIQSKGMPKTYFYAEPGDTIQIAFNTDTAGTTTTIYKGSNAEANNLLADRRLLNDGQISNNTILSILKTQEFADKVLEQLDQEIKKSTQPLKYLLQEGRISKSCCEAMISETEQKMLSWVGSFLTQYFNNDESAIKQVKLSKKEMSKLTQQLFDHYDPYSSKNLIATTNYTNSHTKSLLREKAIIPAQNPKVQLWSQYDTKFGMVVNEVSPLDYAPDNVQMLFLGSSLLTATVFKPMSDDDYTQVFNTYYNKFPASPYIPMITAFMAEKTQSIVQEQNNFKFGVYRLEDQSIQLIEQDLHGVDTITTIQALIKKNFQGSPVFVDFWATWCSPCIAEFRNEPKLRKFSEDNNIKMLNVSIDNKRSVENWRKMVGKYQLTGYHYLANQDVYENLNKWFVGIPRYMIFNAQGEVIHDNLLKPSNGDALLKQISQLLKK